MEANSEVKDGKVTRSDVRDGMEASRDGDGEEA